MTRICFYAGQDDILHSCRASVQTQCANAETRSRNAHPGTRNGCADSIFNISRQNKSKTLPAL